MLEKTTNDVTRIGVIGRVCIERPTPPTPRPPPPPELPRPPPVESGGDAVMRNMGTFSVFTEKVYWLKMSDGTCTKVIDTYRALTNTSQLLLNQVEDFYGAPPPRQIIPLQECPEDLDFPD